MGIIFETGYYDGFVSGHYEDEDGKRYYASMVRDSWGDDEEREYGLFELSDEEWEREDEAHKDFEGMVGTHCCHHLPIEEREVKQGHGHEFWKKWNRSTERLNLLEREPVRVISERELYGRD